MAVAGSSEVNRHLLYGEGGSAVVLLDGGVPSLGFVNVAV